MKYLFLIFSMNTVYIFLALSFLKNIADKLLEPYGDVIGEFQTLLDRLSKSISTAKDNLNGQEKNLKTISNKTNVLNKKENELYNELIKLENDLINITIPADEFSIGFKNNSDHIKEILINITTIENELYNWNKLTDNYNKNNLYTKLMNIPHSVSEDLSLLENIMSENNHTIFTDTIKEDLTTVFKEIATVLDFTGILKNIEDLKITAENNRLAVIKEIKIFEKLVDTEEEAVALQELSFNLEDLLYELHEVLNDISIDNLSEIDTRIQQTEMEIDNYLIKTNCYIEFVQNCHIQQPNTIQELPKCIVNHCNI